MHGGGLPTHPEVEDEGEQNEDGEGDHKQDVVVHDLQYAGEAWSGTARYLSRDAGALRVRTCCQNQGWARKTPTTVKSTPAMYS